MTAMSVTGWLSLLLVAFAVIPTVWVLGREAVRRRMTKRALSRIEMARARAGDAGDAGAVAKELQKAFDPLTVERTVVQMLHSDQEGVRAWGGKLFDELKLVDRYATLLRDAKKWSERTHAAEILGLAAVPTAIPALVATLNDRFEDEDTVKLAAASALAKLRDPSAIPLLVRELVSAEDRSSRNVADSLVAFGAMAIAPLQTLLADPLHPTGRVWAARILGRIGDSRAVDDLVTRLQDRDDLLRMAAAEALGLIADPRSMQPLARATLRDPAPQVRANAAGAMARIESERAVDVLVAALADPDHATRLRALEAFETIEVKDTSHLESALRDPNADVRRRAGLALERVGYVERVVGDLVSPDRAASKRAYEALLELGRVGLIDGVAGYLHHESFEVRAIVARACGEVGAPRIASLMLGRLTDPSWPVRAALVTALGQLKPDGAASALVPMLADDEESVREAAADALTNFPEPDLAAHMQALALAYGRGSVRVRSQTIRLLARFEGMEADALLVRACLDPSDLVRVRAVTALGERTGDIRIAPLVACLTDASLDVRMAAIAALGSAATSEAFSGLLSALPGVAPHVRDRIADALSRGARDQLIARLPELEIDPSLDVRLGVCWTLGKCGDAAGVPTLRRFLADPDPKLRASAAGALGKISDDSVIDALLDGVDDPKEQVRAAAVNALICAKPGDARVMDALEARMRDPDVFVRNRALVVLATVATAALEARISDLERDVEPVARLVARAIVGTEAVLPPVLDALNEAGTWDGLLRFLSHEHPKVRAAFFASVHIDDAAATADGVDVQTLVSNYEQLLRTSLDVGARRFAVAALGRLTGGRSIEVLADALSSDPAESVRLAAATALKTKADDAIARKGLLRAVADPSPEVALHAVEALGTRREREVARALTSRLGVGAESVQRAVERTLADIHRSDPFPFMDGMMGSDIPELLIPAVRVLEGMANSATLPLLRELARSTSAPLRAATVRALGALPTDETAAIIDEMVEDPVELVRLAVLDTIVWSGESLLRASLLRRDPSTHVRVQLAVSLARFKGPATKTALKIVESLFEDAAAPVCASAMVTAMVSPDPDGLALFARAWPGTPLGTRFELRTEARRTDASKLLAARLSTSTDVAVRKNAVAALGALGIDDLPSLVLSGLNDPSPEVRIAVIQALAAVDEPDVRKRLSAMLADPDLEVREVARRSMLRSIG